MFSRVFLSILFALVITLFARTAAEAGAIKHVFVVAMENTDADEIYGNTAEAPYINNVLMPQAARASNFVDILPDLASQPHYMVMEGGTNKYPDKTFTQSDAPSASYSTGSREHLTHQMRQTIAPNKVTWMSYQQAMTADAGACPIYDDFPYAPRHNPFVYFRSVSGNPPNKDNPYCARHHRNYSRLAGDLATGNVANYVFITADNCHNMHEDDSGGCPGGSRIKRGDDFLASALPPLISWANAHSGVVFVVWDEGSGSDLIPFFAVGSGVKKNFVSSARLTHRSLVKSVEAIFGLPYLQTVENANTFRSLFKVGKFP